MVNLVQEQFLEKELCAQTKVSTNAIVADSKLLKWNLTINGTMTLHRQVLPDEMEVVVYTGMTYVRQGHRTRITKGSF